MENHGEPLNASKIFHMVQMLYEDSDPLVVDKGEVCTYLLDGSGLDNEKNNSKK